MKGIDVSYYQGTIDWNAVKRAGMEFAILRAGFGNSVSQKDQTFDANAKNAIAAGIQLGAYWFSYAATPDEARQEARACREVLAPYWGKFTYPIYYDYEYDTERYVKSKIGRDPTRAERTAIIAAFLTELESFGWRGGVYTNQDYIQNRLDMTKLTGYELWIANYSTATPNASAGMQQTSSTGKVAGIQGNVDLNTGLRDYPALLRAAGKNGLSSAVDWVSDTTSTVEIARYGVYTLKITGRDITVIPGTPNVVLPIRCRREGDGTFWHLIAIGEPGAEAGLYPAGGGSRICVARVK